MTRRLFARSVTLDSSDPIVRVLEHERLARLARLEQRAHAFTVADIARKADVADSTARRFLGLSRGKRGNTRDPRTSTTRKVFGALGYALELRKVTP